MVTAAHRTLWHFASNALSIVSSDAVVRVSNFVIYAMIARYSGALEFGQLSLALSLFFSFQVLASLGQRAHVIRDIARQRNGSDDRVTSTGLNAALAAAGIGSVFALIPLGLLILAFGWDRQTITVMLVVFTGLLPASLTQVTHGFLQGLERMRLIAYATVPLHAGKALVAAVLIVNGAPIGVVAAVFAVTNWLVFAVEFMFVRGQVDKVGPMPPISAIRESAERGRSFLGVEMTLAINSLTPVLVVSAILGQESVGILGAAQQAVVPLALVINSLVRVAFPAMCRIFEQGKDATRLIVVNLTELIMNLIMPVVVTVSVFSQTLAELLYDGGEFESAADLLQLIVWWSVVNVMTTVMGQTLWATDKERMSLRIALWATSIGLVGNLVFVSLFGVNGVAATMLLVGGVTLIQHQRPLAGSVSAKEIAYGVLRPAVAGAVQVGALLLTVNANQYLRGLLGIVVYLATVIALNWFTSRNGGATGQGRVPFQSFLSSLNGDDPADPGTGIQTRTGITP